MSAILRKLHERFYPEERRITILGLSPAGKTTLLYYLKTGKKIQTISTIGFNVESLDVTTSNGKSLRLQAWDVGTGCGITYLYNTIRIYIASNDALIWMIDSTTEADISESVQALKEILSRLDIDYSTNREILPARRIPILLLANKSDRTDKMPLDKIRIQFSQVISRRMAAIYSSCINDNASYATSGLPEAFDWLLLAIEMLKSSPGGNLPSTIDLAILDPNSEHSFLNKLDSWVSRAETDLDTEVFLEKFRTYTLPSWDHYTHIRIAYVLLTEYGRQEGKDLIFKGLESYISASPQTKGKSFHVTMTYFWIQIVHFGIRNMPTLPNGPQTSLPSASPAPGPQHDFAEFLLINPHVADGNLWNEYHSKEVIMSPQAKAEMVLPDKKPLPNLVVRDVINAHRK